jgi:hypothetical protein
MEKNLFDFFTLEGGYLFADLETLFSPFKISRHESFPFFAILTYLHVLNTICQYFSHPASLSCARGFPGRVGPLKKS